MIAFATLRTTEEADQRYLRATRFPSPRRLLMLYCHSESW